MAGGELGPWATFAVQHCLGATTCYTCSQAKRQAFGLDSTAPSQSPRAGRESTPDWRKLLPPPPRKGASRTDRITPEKAELSLYRLP